MNVALLADLHIGCKAIGDGCWRLDALENVIVPKLRQLSITHVILPGDTLDFRQGISSRTADRANQIGVVAKLFGILGVPSYLLLGNHDDQESCTFLEHMGGPKIVQNDWVDLGNRVGAFLMPGGRDKEIILESLHHLDVSRFDKRILVLHENLPIFHDPEFLGGAEPRFDLIVNGHTHVYRQVRPKVYLLPACLPWDARRGSQCDLKLHYSTEGKITREEPSSPWGFTFFGDDLVPHMEAVEPNVRIAICDVEASPQSAAEAITATLDSLLSDLKVSAKTFVVRVYAPRLPRAVRGELERAYTGKLLDLGIEEWQGSGAVTRDLRARLPNEQAALECVRTTYGDQARAMVEQLAETFFHLKNPAPRKDDILKILGSWNEEAIDREATDSAIP